MPTLSTYRFSRSHPSDAGPFSQHHEAHGPGRWAWTIWSSLNNTGAVLVQERQDNEDVLDLSAVANNPLVLATVNSLLTAQARLIGPLQSTYVPWFRVPIHILWGRFHTGEDMLAKLTIPLHVTTPWPCANANASISYFVFFRLDERGSLRAVVEGHDVWTDGGWPCRDGIIESLRNAAREGFPRVQGLLADLLPGFTRGRSFERLYFLPGNGTRTINGAGNADESVALAVLPKS